MQTSHFTVVVHRGGAFLRIQRLREQAHPEFVAICSAIRTEEPPAGDP